MNYYPFHLEAFDYQLDAGVERFSVLVSESPAGRMTQTEAVRMSLTPDLRQSLRRLDKRLLSLPEMIVLGEELAATLFPAKVRDLFGESKARLQENEGLRIRLMLDAYALADIPWEYIYFANRDTPVNQKGVEGFLATDRRFSILRDPMLEQPRSTLHPVPGQELRLVALLSNPTNTANLDLSAERQHIEQALKEVPGISPQFYENATIDALEEAMIKGAHIFHYSGHGTFQEDVTGREGKGFLVLTSSLGGEHLFSATKLAMTLASRGVRLAMLGACDSSRVDRVNAWTGIAPALMRAGIPAVVGMQFSVFDDNAILFSRMFYRALAAGQSIDEAVAEGRLSIFRHAEDDSNERDWGVPVLYLRPDNDGVLFPLEKDSESLGVVLKEAQDELKGELGELGETFNQTLRQIDIVTDYKELHDILHDMQFAWFPRVRQNVAGLPDAKGALPELLGHQRKLRDEIGRLRDTVDKKKVPDTHNAWINTLEEARLELKSGTEREPKMDLINSAVSKIASVLQIQPKRINGSLMRAVGALNLPVLREGVQKVLDKLIIKNPKSEIIERFRQGIKDLEVMTADLDQLSSEHDIWQANESTLTIAEYSLNNLAAFKNIWEPLKNNISSLYQGKSEEWEVDIRSDEASLDRAIEAGDTEAATYSYRLFSDGAKKRFWDVDKLIKQNCKDLADIRLKMVSDE